MRVQWSKRALRKLNEIAEYIAHDAPIRAVHFADLLYERVTQLLEQFPKAGRQVPERDDSSLREYTFENYVIVYRIYTNHILVLMIFHTKQLRA